MPLEDLKNLENLSDKVSEWSPSQVAPRLSRSMGRG